MFRFRAVWYFLRWSSTLGAISSILQGVTILEVEIAGRFQGVAVVDVREALRGEEAWCCKLHRLGSRYMRLKEEVLAVRFGGGRLQPCEGSGSGSGVMVWEIPGCLAKAVKDCHGEVSHHQLGPILCYYC